MPSTTDSVQFVLYTPGPIVGDAPSLYASACGVAPYGSATPPNAPSAANGIASGHNLLLQVTPTGAMQPGMTQVGTIPSGGRVDLHILPPASPQLGSPPSLPNRQAALQFGERVLADLAAQCGASRLAIVAQLTEIVPDVPAAVHAVQTLVPSIPLPTGELGDLLYQVSSRIKLPPSRDVLRYCRWFAAVQSFMLVGPGQSIGQSTNFIAASQYLDVSSEPSLVPFAQSDIAATSTELVRQIEGLVADGLRFLQ